MATEQDSRALVRRFMETVVNQGELAAVDAFVADDFTNVTDRYPHGRERWRGIATMWRSAFPDGHFPVEEELVQGDTVVQRLTRRGTHLGELRQPTIGTVPPTGRSFAVEQIHLWRLAGGTIVAHWGTRNDVLMLRQLGVWPCPAPPP